MAPQPFCTPSQEGENAHEQSPSLSGNPTHGRRFISPFPVDVHTRYFTHEGLRAEVHSSTAHLTAYAEFCALERAGVTADDLTPNELREIVGNASTDRRNALFAASDNPHRDNEPPPIKQEVADDDGGKIPALPDRDLPHDDRGGIPTFVRVSQDSPTCQIPFASAVLPPPSDSDGSRFSDSSESFDDLSVNALCSGDAPPAPMAVDTQGPSESHDAPHVAPPPPAISPPQW